ncbi:patatin-like phospholipase family protein [Nitrosovibrio sp. Nv17]|uniref:patatin-like phospholipase family protein n=1 Tax=Nitrosovibrio sp. Nv17 TaxID=1855339 RepID=UPI000908D733|nr:patatin-like phospholipase family protein [Nitrosovibrio sp. Nv17]SFW26697.1 Patatin-like phospholipase [Nitrosovibrio sp. Nv17]
MTDSSSGKEKGEKQEHEKWKENYCDVIMKGGITSGIVYPKAIATLAKHYRLKSIGGTSAGALAACLAAAAEYRRSTGGDYKGYAAIEGLSDELRCPPEEAPRARISTLFGLFQPSHKTDPLFKILQGTLNKQSAAGRIYGAIRAAFSIYRMRVLAGFGIGLAVAAVFLFLSGSLSSCSVLESERIVFSLLVGLVSLGGCGLVLWVLGKSWPSYWKTLLLVPAAVAIYYVQPVACAVALSPAFILGAMLAAIWVIYTLYRLVIEIMNDDGLGFALCTGMSGKEKPEGYEGYKPLTEWLNDKIQEISGKNRPLTFGDLWGAKGFPAEAWPYSDEEKELIERGELNPKSINLQLVTTNLTRGCPHMLPSDDEHEPIYFNYDELEPFFPRVILDHLKNNSKCSSNGCHRLPPAKELPVLFAARLSLSFPGLLSAIPLYMEKPGRDKPDQPGRLERCWFSDGGITSNFPIHFFDSFLPTWPTFGFTLGEVSHSPKPGSNEESRVGAWMPESNTDKRGETWDGFDNEKGLNRFTGFCDAIFNTARNWNDNTLTRMPGVRERVAHIYLSKGEGGLNLDMDRDVIKKLEEYGEGAADEIMRRYICRSQTSNGSVMDFDNHAWIRVNTFIDMLGPRILELQRVLKGTGPVDYGALIITGHCRNQYRLTIKDVSAISTIIVGLKKIQVSPSGTMIRSKDRPLPRGELRGRPPF